MQGTTKILYDIQESFNNLTIINFNYDVSLEYFLYSRIQSFGNFRENLLGILKNFSKTHIIHVYGSLYKFSWQQEIGENTATSSNQTQYMNPELYGSFSESRNENTLRAMQKAWLYRNNIHVIGGEKHNHLHNSPEIIHARNSIQDAKNIIFLGYGFDPDNNQLIGFDRGNLNIKEAGSVLTKQICYTNFKGSKKVSKIFSSVIPEDRQKQRVFQSDRDVYSALAYDFDLI